MADKMKVARKLHSQFSHPSTDKIFKLINNPGFVDDEELKEAIIEISQTCEICKVYRKPGYKAVVSVPLAEEFNEVVAVDLKFIESNIILHLIDHVTRFSAAAIVISKEREEIIKHLFRSWISIFGAPSKFFSGNGGEFSNDNYNAMGEAYNITIKKTAAESPFSNDLVERHNAVLEEMLLKTCDDTGASVEVALQWVINAKNSLTNIHGFSPYQLVFGRNPRLPNVLCNRPPAFESINESKAVAENLRSMHNARQAFIKSESSEKISRALCHNLRSYKDDVFVTGDSVYYKRNDSKRWKGPGKVIGVDGQQILVKHGSTYIRCHPSHVTLKDEKSSNRSFTSSIHADENASKSSTTDMAANKRCGNISNQSENNPTTTESHPDIWSNSDDEQTQNDIEPSNGSVLEVRIPKKGTKISYKAPEGKEKIQATVLGRAGKATSKNKYWYSVQNDDQSLESLNSERITEWNEIPTESILLTQV